MKRVVIILCVIVCACGVLQSALSAGEVPDRLLNQMVLDAHNKGTSKKDYKSFDQITSIGQTFTTGANITEIGRIAVGVAWFNDQWTKDESLALTLWDSPAKANKLAENEIPYKWRAWEGDVLMFTLNAKVQPSTPYYFELTVKGGDGKIMGIYNGMDYDGSAYENGNKAERNIWFQVHSRPTFDRDKLYSDMLSNWNMDYPGLEKMKSAYQAKDWDKAIDALIAYYEARPELVDPNDVIKLDPKYDRAYADLVMDKKIKDSNGEIVDLGPNWNYFRSWPTRGGVGLTRNGIMGHFRAGYLRTGDESFAKGYNDMMASMIEQLPCPLRSGGINPGAKDINPSPGAGITGGSMWSGLSIGARMNQMWYFYSGMHSSPSFTRDVRAAMIFNMVNMMDVLAIQRGGGNWQTQMMSALYEASDRHPELVNSRARFEKSLANLMDNLWIVSRPDGATQEPTSNYHTLMVNRFLRTLEKCKEKSIPIEQKYVDRVEKILDYTMYATQPDGRMPSTGDTFNYKNGLDLLSRGAAYYGRSDYLWVATKGAEGTPPLATSCQFPVSGWFVMRSDWSPDGLYLNLHNGISMGHGHADEMQIVVNAYGSPLIIDPGCFIYGTAKQGEMATTKRHATVSVDGRNTVTAKGESKWASMRTIDYYNGTNAGFSDLDGITHTRKIAFLKPQSAGSGGGYWVMSDTANGSGEHDITSTFPFALGTTATMDASGACHTNNKTGNILIVPSPGSLLKGERFDTDFPLNDQLQPAQAARYTGNVQLPATFATALVPYKGGNSPRVKMEQITGDAYRVNTEWGFDYVCFASAKSDAVAFEGDGLVVRDAGKKIRSLAWVNGTSASIGGKQIASAEKSVANLELIYDGDTLTIFASRSEPTLKVAALGVKHLRVGYGPAKEITGAVVEPFK